MYFHLDASFHEDHGVTHDPRLPPRTSFQAGRMLPTTLPEPLVFEVDNTAAHPPADLTMMVIPVMSERLVEALTGLGVDNLQTFAAVLRNPETSEEWKTHRAVNIVGTITAANMKKSKYKDGGGTGVVLVEFDKLVVNEGKARGALMFRLAESPDIMVVHESIKDGLRAVTPPLTGIRFEKLKS
jgi:hypothetical protein